MPEFNDELSRRTEIMGIPFKDIANLPEQDRIIAIGNLAIQQPGKIVGCLVDTEGPFPHHEKADRYIRTLLSIFPTLKTKKYPGPVKGVILIQIWQDKGE